MKLTFWGTRGSIACSLNPRDFRNSIKQVAEKAKDSAVLQEQGVDAFLEELPKNLTQTFGGNSPCIEISHENDRIILDAGSGLRELGNKVMREEGSKEHNFTFLFSHTHWDHICGFPFFIPIYLKNSNINIYGGHDDMQKRFALQHQKYNFPVDFEELKSTINFKKIEVKEKHDINSFTVSCMRQYHPGGSFGFKIERNGRSLVYMTDTEFQDETEEGLKETTDFIRGADMLIFDSMYSFNETLEKVDWGHSSSRVAIKICNLADINKLVLFHHDPECSDTKLHEIYEKTLKLREKILDKGKSLEIINSYDSLELEI